MSGVDPLKLIRLALKAAESDRNPFTYCTAAGEALELPDKDCTHISLPSHQASPSQYIFPRAVATSYRSKRGQGPNYPLDAVCCLLEHRDAGYTEYLAEARRLQLTIVSLTDKKELIEYATGSGNEADFLQLDPNYELPIPLTHFPESAEGLRQQQEQQLQQDKELQKQKSKRSKESTTEGESSKRARESAITATLTCDLVRPVRTIASLFHSSKDFTGLALGLKGVFGGSSARKEAESGSLFDQISSANPNSAGQSGTRKPSNKPWIIIVPASTSALITMYNAQEFLENGNYVPVAQAKTTGVKPVNIQFKHNGMAFEIIDNPARLALSDWSRVLACFCVSSTWQFKGWKWENPVELFQHVLGFHLYFDDVAVEASVAGWNVTKIALSRNKRHLDATAVMNFWNRVEEALKYRK